MPPLRLAAVTPGTVVPSGVVYAGSPAKPLRPLTAAESAFIAASAENYAALAERHAAECAKPGLQAAAEYEADFEAGFVDHDAPVPAAALRAVRDA